MRLPRTLLAGSTALALVAALASGAIAAPGDGTDSGGALAPSPAAPPAPRHGTSVPDDLAATGDGLAAALSGNAALALTTVNQLRAQAGAPAVTADPALTSRAQAWAQAGATAGSLDVDPDLTIGLPDGWMDAGDLYASGSTSVGVAALLTAGMSDADFADVLAYPTMTHAGVGYATDGSGHSYVYVILTAYPFRDVAPSDVFFEDISFLYRYGITTGYSDGTFRPVGSVTRESMAAFLFRFVDLTPTLPTCDPATPRAFSDVSVGNPFCGAIEWLATTGITTGYPDGTFRPGQPVTREAMAAFINRFWNFWNDDPQTPLTCDPAEPRTFTDVSAGHPFCGAIEWLAGNNISTGWSDHTFRPGQQIARQAMAAFLNRFNSML